MKRFVAARKDVIVATNALGLGINIPTIQVVIHYNYPNILISYV